MSRFSLDARLRNDTHWIGELPLSIVLLMDDARYPWIVLVPRVEGASELIDLDAAQQRMLLAETDRVSRAVASLFHPDKQNIAALGNIVAQLHVHVIARYRDDAAWPRPVWGEGDRVAYSASDLQARVTALHAAIGIDAN